MRLPTPATIIALIALFVAMGGTTYAAVSLPARSVGTKQLKNHAVTKPKIARKTLAALKGRRGAKGPQGLQGLQGPQGPQGSPGIMQLTRVEGNTITLCGYNGGACSVGTSTATCPTGYYVVGGGYGSDGAVLVPISAATDSTSYSVLGVNLSASTSASLIAQAICAHGAGLQAAKAKVAGTRSDLAAAADKLRALRR